MTGYFWYSMASEQWESKFLPETSYITIADIKALRKGDKLELLSMHRNVYDLPCSLFPPDRGMPAALFFRDSCCVYQHKSGISGSLEWKNMPWDDNSFEFDVLLEEYGLWYPMKDGTVSFSWSEIGAQYLPKHVDLTKRVHKHWKELPETTKLGLRGPMVRWSSVENKRLPLIYCNG